MSSQTVFVTAGVTSWTIDVALVQKASATSPGDPITGLVFNTSSLTAYYRKGATGTLTSITLATQTVGGAFSSGGFVEVSSTNAPGLYRFDVPNAVIDTAGIASVTFNGAANMATHTVYFIVTGINLYDSVRAGMTALPNAAAAASGGLHILGTNATAVSYTGGMTISNASGSGLTLSSGGSNGHGLNASGNGSGSGISTTGGATGRGILATGGSTSGAGIRSVGTAGNSAALELAGQGSAAGFISTGGATGNGMTLTGGSTSGHGLQCTVTSGNEIDADRVGTLTGNITGNLSGSVGSVTGTVAANVTQFGGNAGTFSGGIPSVNTVQWKGSAPADLVSTYVPVHLVQTATDAITATSIAADAIGSSELAASAATEIRDAVYAKVVETNGSYTFDQAVSVMFSVLAGRTSSGTFKTPDNVATRAVFTYTGNDRTGVTITAGP